MNRTIPFGNLEVAARENSIKIIDELLEAEIVSILKIKQTQMEYDNWYQILSTKRIDVYDKHVVHFIYCQDEKWIR